MKKIIPALVAAFSLAALITVSAFDKRPISAPVQPLRVLGGDVICTTWEVKPGVWITANHCVADRDQAYFIDLYPASVVERDERVDLAALTSPAHYGGDNPLTVDQTPLALDDAVWTACYPHGSEVLYFAQGQLKFPDFHYKDDKGELHEHVFMLPTARGCSGAPIIRDGGYKVITVLQIGDEGQMSGGLRQSDFLQWIGHYLK